MDNITVEVRKTSVAYVVEIVRGDKRLAFSAARLSPAGRDNAEFDAEQLASILDLDTVRWVDG